MTVDELYKKLGEILEKGDVRESSPVWFIGGDDELVSVENLEIDNDGDIILTMWTKEGLYKSKRMV